MAAENMLGTIAHPIETGRWPLGRYLFLFAFVVACYLGLDLADGELHNGDADDLLRAVQVRTLLQTGNWQDLTLPMVRGPESYLSPWSRLVDFPYAILALVLSTFTGLERALEIAFNLWPPVMACIFSVLVVSILKCIAPRNEDLQPAVLVCIIFLMPYTIWEFSPGRIDHHNVQILLLLAIVYGLVRFDVRGGFVVGAAVPLAIAVGLETLPVIAVAMLAVSAAWWFDMRHSARILQATGISCATATLLLAILLIPSADYSTLHNDAFSAPYVEALVGFGLLAVLLPQILKRNATTLRCVVFVGCGLILIAGILVQYPALRYGPFPMIDALVHRYWFDRIHQESTALFFFQARNWTAIALVTAMFAILLSSMRAALDHLPRREPALPALYAIALTALVVACFSNRFLRLALAIVPLLLPIAVVEMQRMFRSVRTSAGKVAVAAGVAFVPAAVVGLMAVIVPGKQFANDGFDNLLMRSCAGEDFSAIEGLSAARLMTPPAIGLQIIGHGTDGISVSSIPFHRASPAISSILRAFMAHTTSERMAIFNDFDYLVVCRSPRGLPGEDSMPLFAALMSDKKISGLEPVPVLRPTGVMLFRINKAVVE